MGIVLIALLLFLLAVFAVGLYYRYRDVKPVVLDPVPDKCAICEEEENEQVFCPRCERRLTLKYAAILLGVLCIPLGSLLGYVYALYVNESVGASMFAGVCVVIVVYNILAFSYFIIYHPKRVDVGILSSSHPETGIGGWISV